MTQHTARHPKLFSDRLFGVKSGFDGLSLNLDGRAKGLLDGSQLGLRARKQQNTPHLFLFVVFLLDHKISF
jgi:hypothetical protein